MEFTKVPSSHAEQINDPKSNVVNPEQICKCSSTLKTKIKEKLNKVVRREGEKRLKEENLSDIACTV